MLNNSTMQNGKGILLTHWLFYITLQKPISLACHNNMPVNGPIANGVNNASKYCSMLIILLQLVDYLVIA